MTKKTIIAAGLAGLALLATGCGADEKAATPAGQSQPSSAGATSLAGATPTPSAQQENGSAQTDPGDAPGLPPAGDVNMAALTSNEQRDTWPVTAACHQLTPAPDVYALFDGATSGRATLTKAWAWKDSGEVALTCSWDLPSDDSHVQYVVKKSSDCASKDSHAVPAADGWCVDDDSGSSSHIVPDDSKYLALRETIAKRVKLTGENTFGEPMGSGEGAPSPSGTTAIKQGMTAYETEKACTVLIGPTQEIVGIFGLKSVSLNARQLPDHSLMCTYRVPDSDMEFTAWIGHPDKDHPAAESNPQWSVDLSPRGIQSFVSGYDMHLWSERIAKSIQG